MQPNGTEGIRLDHARWTRWWQESGQSQLRQILHWKSDPIGVARAFPYAADEYDRYAPQIASALERGASAAEIAGMLVGIERDLMGLLAVHSDRQAVAETILSWYQLSQTRWVEFGS